MDFNATEAGSRAAGDVADDVVELNPVAEELNAKARIEDKNVDTPLAERANFGEKTFGELMASKLQRRTFLKGAAAASAAAAGASVVGSMPAAAQSADTLTFDPITGSSNDEIIVPEGYGWNTIAYWGQSFDGTTPSLTAADIRSGVHLSAEGAENQTKQFGYNCDAAEFFSLPNFNTENTNSGLICVNHEFPSFRRLFNFGAEVDPTNTLDSRNYDNLIDYYTANPSAAEFIKNAMGVAVLEIERTGNTWSIVEGSNFNTRITMNTAFRIDGAAAGNSLLKTSKDRSGTVVLGTYNNCAAGGTPYGTYLTTEENFDQIFGNFSALEDRIGGSTDEDDIRTLEMHRRIRPNTGVSRIGLEATDTRFDVNAEPNEAFRYGWVSELDPYNPSARPRKKTALGRFKHECATTIAASSGPLVVYMGDDARFEYTYKFVSSRNVTPNVLRPNLGLLDEGTLYVAKFNDDGTGEWLAVDYDSQEALQNATIGDTGVATFRNQGDVLVGTRIAADILGATPMDRPEDVEANPVTKKCYIACTNNTRRTAEESISDRQGRDVDNQTNIPNPRSTNTFGHIIEITEAGDDNAATTFTWEIFMMCGDPASEEGRFLTQAADLDENPLQPGDTYFAGFTDASVLPPIGSPDNLSFDNNGNMWIVTDGRQPTGNNDGTYVVPTEGTNRGYLRQFMSTAVRSEVCGAEFTPDNTTIFLNIQHPGDGVQIGVAADVAGSSAFPFFGQDDEPRPSLIGVYRTDGGVVGS